MKLLNLNIFRGYHTQFDEKYNWDNRRDLIKKFVEETNPDIILFQECNKLKHNENMETFMTSCPTYRYSIYYSSPNIYRSKALIIAYNPEKVFKIEEQTKWLSNTPDIPTDPWGILGDNFGRIIVGNKFAKIENNILTQTYFWVFNVHFDVAFNAIQNSIKLLPNLIKNIVKQDYPIIIGGDFNVDDSFKNFYDNGFDKLSNNLTTLDHKSLNYTFIGKRDQYNKLNENEYLLIDFIFGKNIKIYDVQCPFEESFIENEYMMSDHLPLVCICEL